MVLPQQGYPFAAVKGRDIALDPDTSAGDYTLLLDTGPRSRFGGFRSDGKVVFQPGHIAELTRFHPGDLYDNRKGRRPAPGPGRHPRCSAASRSNRSKPAWSMPTAPSRSIFWSISKRARAIRSRAKPATARARALPLPAPGPTRNLWPPEGALIVTGTVGTQEQDLGTTFKRSNAGERDRTETYGIVADHTDETYEAYTATLSWGRVAGIDADLAKGMDLVVRRQPGGVA